MVIRSVANNTAMVWSPTSGLGYPYSQKGRLDLRLISMHRPSIKNFIEND